VVVGPGLASARQRRRWIIAFTLGELLGFGVLATAFGLLTLAMTRGLEARARSLVQAAAAIAGGAVEGAVLASFQWSVLRERLPQSVRGAWLRNTAIAAALAWAAGLAPPTLDELLDLGAATQAVLWVAAALVILPSIGVAQALALRGVEARPRRWVLANVLGWLAGLPWTFVAPALLPDDSPAQAFWAAFLVGGTLMGATAGWVTSRFLPAPEA